MLKNPLICGETPQRERQAILGIVRSSDDIRTVCISKVGDTSIDLVEANVILPLPKLASRKMSAITHSDIIIIIIILNSTD
jgi:DNA excision repair protein ERCC-3